MTHLPPLIQDLAFILMTAAVVTILFRWLKQPVVLGYLIAGFLVGPHVPLVPTITDTASVTVWAEIGVIFLLFGLGLEFSFKKLAEVGKSASITAIFEIVFMLGIGYLVGQALNWSSMDSLFLGGILSISSTTIIVRAFEELGLKGRNFVSLVFGVLIVEDLVAILLLVLLTSVAVSQTLSGHELAFSSLKLAFFLTLWFVLGIYLLPIFLKRVRDYLTDETRLIVSIGLCLMMVLIGVKVGFSPALGAFVMGSLLAETREGHRIEELLVPVKNLFSAVFFVSVGMLIDPKILYEYFGVIVLLTGVTIGGKFLSSTLGALVSGRSLKNSVQAGMSLAQIGEFSFIIATLGLTLKVTSDFLYPIAVAVSALTTFSTPYLIKNSEKTFNWIDARLSISFKERLKKYATVMASSDSKNIFTLVWEQYGLKLIFNSVLVIAIALLASEGALPFLLRQFPEFKLMSAFVCLLTLMLCGPFLWAISIGRARKIHSTTPDALFQLRGLQLGLSLFRFSLGLALVGFVISQFSALSAVAGGGLLAITVFGFFFSRYSEPVYCAIENRFLSNLTDKERNEIDRHPPAPDLAPWDALMVEFHVSPQSPLVAKPLQDIDFRGTYGVTIVMIERGRKRILAPGRSDILLPHDKVFLIGTDDQMDSIREVLEADTKEIDTMALPKSFSLSSIVLKNSSRFVGKNIRESGLRELAGGLIVGIERAGKRILNPDSLIVLETDDLLWIVADRERLKQVE